ncbi:MAG: riboflavin biosynthesis protein RibF [Coriobacteriales bacterium]|nr:riboflavin biosynthesis protein RibF [Coriobacteriales bacterium]
MMEASFAMGVFDGVHQGHRFLISKMVEDARERGVLAFIVTFSIDPDELFLPAERQRKLMSNQMRLATLDSLGADGVVVLPFTHELANTDPFDFLDRILCGIFEPRSIHVGEDFHFGAKAKGDLALIEGWGAQRGCAVTGYPLLELDGAAVSSTRIRDLLERGDMEEAHLLLGRDFMVEGHVVHGRGVGGRMGIPTANVQPVCHYTKLMEGVYAGYALVGDVSHPAVINVGAPASFPGAPFAIEAHLLDFRGDLYDSDLRLGFVSYLRPQQRFDSAQELVATIHGDIQRVRGHLS